MSVVFPQDLRPWVDQVEAHVYANPALAIEAARQLLRHCHSPEHLGYVYEQLGFAHLILGEHRLSSLFYEQARALAPDNMYVLANLAHAQYELGEREQAMQNGRRALALKDRQACDLAADEGPHLQPAHQGPLQLLSFSLYGHLPRYTEMAVLNVLAAQRHLPGFVCRFYIDDTVPSAVVQRLQALGAQCIPLGEQDLQMPATFWRFLAMDDAQADCVLVRDVDALVDAREAWCVQDWLRSDQPFHILRDDCCHTELILAGLCGIRSGVVRGIRQRIGHFLSQSGEAGWKRFGDQLFLRHTLWPLVREHTLTHDPIYGYGHQVRAVGYQDHAQQGPRNTFMGANHATCQIDCTLEQRLPAGTHAVVNIIDASGTLVCRHAMQASSAQPAASTSQDRHWHVRLPQLYAGALQSGLWRTHITTHAGPAKDLGQGSIDPVLLGLGSA